MSKKTKLQHRATEASAPHVATFMKTDVSKFEA